MMDLSTTILLDGSAGGYTPRDYADAIEAEVDLVEVPADIDDEEWGHEVLEELIEDANTVLDGSFIVSWHPHESGILMMASPEWWEEWDQ